jgi:hypothetical protein
MTKVIVGMTVSIDGFAADRNGSASPLYPDLQDLRDTDHMQTMIRETGAVLMGKRAFEMGDPDSYVGTYEFQAHLRADPRASSMTSTWVASTSRSSPCRRWGQGRASPSES